MFEHSSASHQDPAGGRRSDPVPTPGEDLRPGVVSGAERSGEERSDEPRSVAPDTTPQPPQVLSDSASEHLSWSALSGALGGPLSRLLGTGWTLSVGGGGVLGLVTDAAMQGFENVGRFMRGEDLHWDVGRSVTATVAGMAGGALAHGLGQFATKWAIGNVQASGWRGMLARDIATQGIEMMTGNRTQWDWGRTLTATGLGGLGGAVGYGTQQWMRNNFQVGGWRGKLVKAMDFGSEAWMMDRVGPLAARYLPARGDEYASWRVMERRAAATASLRGETVIESQRGAAGFDNVTVGRRVTVSVGEVKHYQGKVPQKAYTALGMPEGHFGGGQKRFETNLGRAIEQVNRSGLPDATKKAIVRKLESGDFTVRLYGGSRSSFSSADLAAIQRTAQARLQVMATEAGRTGPVHRPSIEVIHDPTFVPWYFGPNLSEQG